jgi:hypothetical protein
MDGDRCVMVHHAGTMDPSAFHVDGPGTDSGMPGPTWYPEQSVRPWTRLDPTPDEVKLDLVFAYCWNNRVVFANHPSE